MIDSTDASSYELSEFFNIRIYDAYLRYYMHIQNPEQMQDEEWAEQMQNLHFIRTQEKKATENT